MKIIRFTCALVSIYIILHFFSLAKPYIVPLALASVICFFIIEISEFYKSIKIKTFKIPGVVAMALSVLTIGTVIFVLISIINGNIHNVIRVAPSYQEKIIDLIDNPTFQRFGIHDIPEFDDTIKSINIKKTLSSLTVLAKNITSNLGMIIIYSIFILLEYRLFKNKLLLIFKKEGIGNIIENINRDVRKYVVIKSGASFATGTLSFLALLMVGIDFAALWGITIFLLNFIPTIGSIIAVIPPVLLSLVQFEGLTKFFIVLSSLISIQVLIGNILEPRLAGRSLNLSPLVILLSLVFWGKIWGIVGMFLCVPITVILNIVLANFESTQSIAIMLSANGKIVKKT